jgi:hypothetical protein
MLVPLTHCEPARLETIRTRRPVSGMMAHSMGTPALHAMLARGRCCAVHPVEHHVDAAASSTVPSTTRIGADAEQVVRVVLVPTYRATWLGVSLVYQADPGAFVGLELRNMAGSLRSTALTLSTANGGLDPQPRIDELRYLTTYYTYPIRIACTGDTRSTAATLRAVDVLRAAALGAPHELRVIPSTGAGTRIRILAVGVYELLDREVAL